MQNSENLDQSPEDALSEILMNTETPKFQDNGAAGSLDDRIAELETQLAEAKAAVLYVKADGENIRRRAMDDIVKAR